MGLLDFLVRAPQRVHLGAAYPDERPATQPPLATISEWCVDRVRSALREHERGQFANSAHLADYFGRNPRIASAARTRALAVIGLPFDIKAGDGDGRRNDPAVTRLKPHWPRIFPRSAQFQTLHTHYFMGPAFSQIVWDTSTRDWIPTLEPWHASHFWWHEAERRWYVNTLEGTLPIDPGAGQWVVFGGSSVAPWLHGTVRCLGLENEIRQLAVRDWARFSEVHGMPTVLAHVPMTAKAEDKREFARGWRNRGSEAVVIAPRNADGSGFGAEFLEPRDNAHEVFAQLVAMIDSDVAVAIRGENFSTEPQSGVYTPKNNSTGVRLDYIEADACLLAEGAREHGIKPWARYNLGPGHEDSAPRAEWDATPPEDKSAKATTIKTVGEGVIALNTAAQQSGSKRGVDFEAVAGQFCIPLTDAPPPAPPAPAPAPPTGASKAPGRPASGNGASALAAGAGDPAKGLLEGQAYVDAVADAAQARAPAALRPVLAKVLAALEASADYEDLRARIVALGPGAFGVDAARFRELLAASMRMAASAGVWSVAEDAAQ